VTVKPASSEARSVSDAYRTWRRDVEQWHEEIQRFLSETLTEVRDLIETVEAQSQAEPVSRLLRNAAAVPDSAVVESPASAGAAKLPRELRAEQTGSGPSTRIDTAAGDRDAVTIFPSAESSGAETSDDRLAQLARRLEEKLERSSSRGQDTRR
jgi:hypothetical protein